MITERWEYRKFSEGSADFDKELNNLGKEGWEAYSVTGGVNDPVTVWLKRRIYAAGERSRQVLQERG